MAKYPGYTHNQLYVWTTSNWSTWTRRDRLIPTTADLLPRGEGFASFQLLAKNRRNSSGSVTDTYEPSVKEGIAISTASTTFSSVAPLWTGMIESVSKTPIRDIDDAVGTVSANNFSAELSRRKCINMRMKDISPSALPGGIELDYAPTFNIRTKSEAIQGNAVSGETDDGIDYKQFAVRLEDLGTVWTRRNVADHVIRYCWPTDLPSVTILDMIPLGSPANDTTSVESWDLNGLTIKEALDLVLTPGVGITWSINYDEALAEFIVLIIPTTDQLLGLTTESIQVGVGDSQLTFDEIPPYDAVEVKGSRIVFGASFPYPLEQGAISKAWSATAEAAYIAGASSEVETENAEVRGQPHLEDVYNAFKLEAYTPYWDPFCKGSSGSDWTTMPAAPVCKEVTWDKGTSTLALNPAVGKSPNLATIRILPWIPWYKGVKVDGTDERSDEMVLRGETLPPQVYLADGSKAGTEITWYDLLNPEDPSEAVPQVEVDTYNPFIRIKYSPPEILAGATWDDEFPSAESPNYPEVLEGGDYRDLVVTMAIESAQSLKVTELRSGVTTPSRILSLDRPDLKCWVMRAYSVLGVEGGLPVETSTDTFVRGQLDYELAQALADKAALYAFKARTNFELTLTTTNYTRPSWCYLGAVIANIREQSWNGTAFTDVITRSDINTLISSIRWNFRPDSATMTIASGQFDSAFITPPGLGASPLIAIKRVMNRMNDWESNG